MTNNEQLQSVIKERLSTVIDPETGADVIRMKLVDDLTVDPGGNVNYTFRPSSPLCPIAVYLVMQIKEAIAGVEGVGGQTITVKDYVEAEALTKLINQDVADQ